MEKSWEELVVVATTVFLCGTPQIERPTRKATGWKCRKTPCGKYWNGVRIGTAWYTNWEREREPFFAIFKLVSRDGINDFVV